MLRRLLLAGAALSMLAPSAVSAGKPPNVCPPGFDLGAKTLEQWVALDRTQLLISDGLATLADVTASFEGIDRNGDGFICGQLSIGFQQHGPYSVYSYNATDDNASVPD